MDAPNYVQGLYSVAERDAIFTKAKKYPDAADGLQNQVPTIFPDGSIGWRQIPEGGDGTANANIAVVESTQYASRDYKINDLLIYNDQLYRVSTPIAAGEPITPETNVVSTTVALWAPESFVPLVGKGVNLLDNSYFIGGGTGYGVFPVNQRGDTTGYVGTKYGIDRWWMSAAGGTVTPRADGLEIAYTGTNCALFQFFMDGVIIPGNQYTGTLLFSDGSILTGTAVASEDGSYTEFSRNTKTAFGIRKFTKDGVQRWCFVFANITTDTIKIAAAKLELGSQQTLARKVGDAWVLNDPPPDYGEELAKCQRYLLVLDGAGNANSYKEHIGSVTTTNQAGFYVPTPVTMSGTPSVSLLGTSPVFSQYYSTPAVSGSVTALAVNHIIANGLYVLATCPGISSAGIVGLGLKGKVIVSAEL